MRHVTIFMRLREKSYLQDYLRSIFNQSFAKSRTHLFIDMAGLDSEGAAIVRQFIAGQKPNYAAIHVAAEADRASDAAVRYAVRSGTHYLLVDENVILHPRTLQRLHDRHLKVVAPMLFCDGVYSNFHAAVDDNGYYREADLYFKILNRELKGIHEVPVVNACYLVRHSCLRFVNYHDDSGRLEYVVFSENLRKHGIPQYFDNTSNYGILVSRAPVAGQLENEQDIVNNKQFYLAMPGKGKRGIICDADWLAKYVIVEHLYLIRLLHGRYDFHIINCGRLDFTSRAIIDDLNTYDVLLTAYHIYAQVPLDQVNSYKIYKIDDMENEPRYTEIVKFNITNSDMIVSPYAYVFSKYYSHENVKWLPYSCALECLAGHERIRFNPNPKPKVLQSGHLLATYPFRQYVASLDNDNVEKLPHQGWRQSGDDQAVINLKYYEKLNEYLCCFTDALSYGYIVLKNFEIAAAGALLLTDQLVEKEMNELGFIDQQTCIFCNRENFLEKVAWILDPANRQRVDEIRRAGMRLVRERHLTRHRAAEFNDLVRVAAASRSRETADDGSRNAAGGASQGVAFSPAAAASEAPTGEPLLTTKGTRLYTTHGTALYVDPASGELRHGALGSSPPNVRLALNGGQCTIMYDAGGSLKPVLCSPEACRAVDSPVGDSPVGDSPAGDARIAGEAENAPGPFRLVRLYASWVGLRAAGKFLCAEPDGRVTLSKPWWRSWESFRLSEPLPNHSLPRRPSLAISCIETRDISGAVQAVERTAQCVKADRLYWFSNRVFPNRLDGVEVIHVPIPPFTDFPDEINRICLDLMPRTVTADFNLTVQADGFAVNPQAWDDRFCDYDYVGGAWPASFVYGPFPIVGNGGFSLRSRKLYDALLDLRVKWRVADWLDDERIANDSFYNPEMGWIPEDVIICLWYREVLEERYGIRFCPPELANKFSVSDIVHPYTSYWLGRSFGFHGRLIASHYGIDA